jgi:hypothetical protein
MRVKLTILVPIPWLRYRNETPFEARPGFGRLTVLLIEPVWLAVVIEEIALVPSLHTDEILSIVEDVIRIAVNPPLESPNIGPGTFGDAHDYLRGIGVGGGSVHRDRKPADKCSGMRI